MQRRWSPDSGPMGPGLAGVGDLEPGPQSRGHASCAKTGRAAPAHSGHRACKTGPGRAAGHLADSGQQAQRPPPLGASANPPAAAASALAPLPPGPRPEPRRRSLSPAARPGCMEPAAGSKTAEPGTAREASARYGDGRKKMAAAVTAAASHAQLTLMARAGRRTADSGGSGGPGSTEGRGEAGRGPAGGGGRAGGCREAVGKVCCARNMAGVGDATAQREGGGGGADIPEREGRGDAEQPGGGGHGPPPAPQHTETLGFYESDRRRERRRSRAGEKGGRAALGRGEGAEGGGGRRGTAGCELRGRRCLRGRRGVGARSRRSSRGSAAADSSSGGSARSAEAPAANAQPGRCVRERGLWPGEFVPTRFPAFERSFKTKQNAWYPHASITLASISPRLREPRTEKRKTEFIICVSR